MNKIFNTNKHTMAFTFIETINDVEVDKVIEILSKAKDEIILKDSSAFKIRLCVDITDDEKDTYLSYCRDLTEKELEAREIVRAGIQQREYEKYLELKEKFENT